MKVITEGRLHVDGTLCDLLRDAHPDHDGHAAAALLLNQAEADDNETFALMVQGAPSEDLRPGLVLLNIGPIGLVVALEDLLRAVRPFEERRG